MQDRHAGFQVRNLDIGDQAHREAGDQPLLQPGDLAGGPIGGNHDLAARLMQGVEGVEKLLLGVFLALNELNVVHQDQVGGAVAVAEGLHAVLADRLNQVVGEGFGAHIKHPRVGVDLQPVVADRLHQVGFAQPHATAEEQGVELPSWCLSYGESRSVGHAAVGPHHEAVEHVAGVEAWSQLPGRFARCPRRRITTGQGHRSHGRLRTTGGGSNHVITAGCGNPNLNRAAGDLTGNRLDRA